MRSETSMTAPSDIEEYLAALPEGPRAVLQELRRTIAAAAPGATEAIAYGMPAFRLGGRFLVSYAAYKDHCSLFPASEAVRAALAEELAPNLSGKGTIRFRAEAPLPAALVRRIVEVRLEEVA